MAWGIHSQLGYPSDVDIKASFAILILVVGKAILKVKPYPMLKYQKPTNFKTSRIPNLYRMLEEHWGVGGHLGELAGPDAYVDEEPEDERDVAVKVESKHSTVNKC